MPRDDDFDDDEYRPRKCRDQGRGRTPVAVVLGLALVAAVIAGLGILLVSRNRQAAEQARRALGENEAALVAAEQQKQFVVEKRRSNWEKVIGTWVREPGAQDKGGRPYRFEFRNDQTALTIRTNIDGNPQQHEGRIEVLADQGNRLMLRMEIPNGTISYTFQFRPNGTIVLDSSTGDLVFTRLK